jgi:hypothetical protein
MTREDVRRTDGASGIPATERQKNDGNYTACLPLEYEVPALQRLAEWDQGKARRVCKTQQIIACECLPRNGL